MSENNSKTVADYIQEQPPEKRVLLEKVRAVILRHLPDGYEEVFRWNMITYEIPLERYPETYNKQPLMYAALASQKNYFSLYLTCVYSDKAQQDKLRQAFANIGKSPNMGKSCIRFTRLEDIPLDAIGKIIAATSVDEHIRLYEASRKK